MKGNQNYNFNNSVVSPSALMAGFLVLVCMLLLGNGCEELDKWVVHLIDGQKGT